MGPRKCEVCREAQSKYKCPSCLAPYCSLSCFKKHKEIPCEKPIPSEEKQCPTVLPDKLFPVDDINHALQKTQFESIVQSTDVCDILKDENLRKLIYNIDSSKSAETELDKAMELDDFRKFTEKVLSAIDL